MGLSENMERRKKTRRSRYVERQVRPKQQPRLQHGTDEAIGPGDSNVSAPRALSKRSSDTSVSRLANWRRLYWPPEPATASPQIGVLCRPLGVLTVDDKRVTLDLKHC